MMHLNRLLTRRQIVELNDLTHEEESAVFSLLKPFQGEGESVFLEIQADRVIEVVRLGGAFERIGTCEAPGSAAAQHEDRPPPDPRRCVQRPEHHQRKTEGEDYTMVSLDPQAEPLERIANGLDRLIEALMPKASPEAAPSIRMFTTEEASKAMRLNSETVVKWCRVGKLAGTKVGRKWLVPSEAIDAYLRRQEMVYGRVWK
jgi:excisionase family DNA binding protein